MSRCRLVGGGRLAAVRLAHSRSSSDSSSLAQWHNLVTGLPAGRLRRRLPGSRQADVLRGWPPTTRVTVSAILGQLAAGRSSEQILADYPYLERADILAALEFAAAAVQGRCRLSRWAVARPCCCISCCRAMAPLHLAALDWRLGLIAVGAPPPLHRRSLSRSHTARVLIGWQDVQSLENSVLRSPRLGRPYYQRCLRPDPDESLVAVIERAWHVASILAGRRRHPRRNHRGGTVRTARGRAGPCSRMRLGAH